MISVIIPTWQRHGLLLNRALPSVLAQQADLEVVVVSDGPESTEFVGRVLALDPRVRFLDIPRPRYPAEPRARWHAQGVQAINHGIDAARGDHLLVMGDDDELVDLTPLVGNADVVYGASDVRQRDGRWLTWLPPLGDFSAFPFGAALIDRASLGDMRLDPTPQHIPADRDFWQRLQAAGLTFAQVSATVFRYWPSTAYELSA